VQHQVPHARIALQENTLLMDMISVFRALWVHTAVQLQLQQQEVATLAQLVNQLQVLVHKVATLQYATGVLKGHTPVMVLYQHQAAYLVELDIALLVLEP